jgi:hypothetical protein
VAVLAALDEVARTNPLAHRMIDGMKLKDPI